MRIIHGKGYTSEDRKGYTTLVHSNVVMAIQGLLSGATQLGLELNNSANKVGGRVYGYKRFYKGATRRALVMFATYCTWARLFELGSLRSLCVWNGTQCCCVCVCVVGLVR